MSAALLETLIEHADRLTLQECDAIGRAYGDAIGRLATTRRTRALAAASSTDTRVDQWATAAVEILKRAIAPRDARIDALERERDAMRDRLLVVEAALAAREPVPE